MSIAQTLKDKIAELEIKPPIEEFPEYYRSVAHFYAFGADTATISAMTGRDPDEVKAILKMPYIQDMAYKIQKRYANRDFGLLFKSMMPDAIDVTRDIMLNQGTKESTRLTAAFAIMDRAMGRPLQTMEVGGSLLREIFERLDKHEKLVEDRTIDAATGKKEGSDAVEDAEIREPPAAAAPTEETKVINEIDQWARKNLK